MQSRIVVMLGQLRLGVLLGRGHLRHGEYRLRPATGASVDVLQQLAAHT